MVDCLDIILLVKITNQGIVQKFLVPLTLGTGSRSLAVAVASSWKVCAMQCE